MIFKVVVICALIFTINGERVVRSPNKGGNSDFEKFFLKASKSVPRIGRRNEDGFKDGYPWGDLAYIYEYHPELLASDQSFEQRLHDDYQRTIPARFMYQQ